MSAAATEMSRWLQWCRICAREDFSGIKNIFLNEIEQHEIYGTENIICKQTAVDNNSSNNTLSNVAKTIEKYFTIKIENKRNLPEIMCNDCYMQLCSVIKFGRNIASVQEMFGELLQMAQNAGNSALDLGAIRLKYGILKEDCENPVVLLQESLTELECFEEGFQLHDADSKSNVIELENPLDYKSIKIEKEDSLDAGNSDIDALLDEKAMDDDDDDSDEDYTPAEEKATKTNKASSEEDESLDEENPISNKQTHDATNEKNPLSNKKSKKTKAAIMRKKYPLTNEFSYCCSECGSKYKFPDGYRQHMKKKHNKLIDVPGFKCTECKREFSTNKQLEKHSNMHIPIESRRIAPCPHCDKKFTSIFHVQSHIKCAHVKERNFVCDECGVTFNRKYALQTHLLLHSGVRPFSCEICKKGFKEKNKLQKHMETHDSTKHICPECGQELNSRYTLKNHMLVHSDQMPFKCDYCGRAFKRAKTLKTHLIVHVGIKPYTCEFCKQTFSTGSSCRLHKRKIHPVELAALEATGTYKSYTHNLPKLATLRAITKVANNLEPVASKSRESSAVQKINNLI